MDSDLVSILLELKQDIGQVKADMAATRAAVEALAGPQGRVTALEQSQNFQKYYTYGIAPVLILLRQIAHHFGL